MRGFWQQVRTHLLSLSLFWRWGDLFNGIWYNEYVMMIHLKGYLVLLLLPSDDHWYHFTSSHLDSWVRKNESHIAHNLKTLPSFLPCPIWVLNNKSITLTQHDNWRTSKKLNNNELWVGLWVIRALSLSLKLGQKNTDILFWESWNDEHEITHDLISLSLSLSLSLAWTFSILSSGFWKNE